MLLYFLCISGYAPSILELFIRRSKENSLKPNLDIKIKEPKTIKGSIRSFHKMENSIGSVIEILGYRQKKTLLLYMIE